MSRIKAIESKGRRFLTRVVTRLIKTQAVTRDEILATPPKRVLVIRQHNQMGDMLLAVPAYRALKETFPGVHVTVLTAPINRDVLFNNPYVDEVVTFNSRRPFAVIPLIRRLRRARYDMTIVLHTVSFSFTSAALGLFSGARFRIGSTSRPFGNELSGALYHFELPLPSEEELAMMNEAEHNLFPLRALGVTTEDLAPLLVPTDSQKAWAREFVDSTSNEGATNLVVHPGAGKIENIWPPQRFATTVNLLAQRMPLNVLVVQGPRDAEPVAEFSRLTDGEPVVIAKRSIGEVAAVMLESDLVLCNDTGVMHVSVAAGARTLAVFGPTDPDRWAPRSKSLHIVRGSDGNLAEITPDIVLAAALALLGETASR